MQIEQQLDATAVLLIRRIAPYDDSPHFQGDPHHSIQ